MAGVSLGTGWIDIAASGSTLAKDIAKQFTQIEGSAAKTGQSIGRALQTGASSTFDLSKAESELKSLQAAADKSSKGVEAALHKQGQAALTVKQRTLELSDAQARYGAESSQVIAKEKQLADAKFKLNTATQQAQVSEAAHAQSLDKVAKASDDLQKQSGKASSGVKAIGDESSAARGPVAQLADELRNKLGMSAENTGGKLSKLGGVLKGGLKVVGGVAAGAALAGVGAAAAGAGAALTAGFSRLNNIDQATAKLRGLGHSAEGVENIMDSALASVKGTAFGLDEAATVAATAVAAGVKPGADLTKTLSLVGDASTIAGTGMDEMGSIFNKIAASNKIQAEEMNQLMGRGIPIQQMLADHLGVSVEQVQSLSKEGKIGFADFQAAMDKGLGGAALESGNTFSGAMDNMQAALGRVGAEFLGPAFAQGPNVIGGITSALDGLTPAAAAAGTFVSDAMSLMVGSFTGKGAELQGEMSGPMMNFFTNIGATARDTLVPAFKRLGESLAPLGTAFMNLLGFLRPIGEVIAGIAIAAFAAAWSTLQSTVDFLVPKIVSLTGFLNENKTAIMGIGAVVLSAVAGFKAYQATVAIVTAVKTAWTAITKAGTIATIAQTVATRALNLAMRANPIGIIVTLLAALVGGLIYAYKNSETFRNIVTSVWNGIKAAAEAVVNWFTGTVFPFFTGLWEKLSGGDGPNIFQQAWGGIKTFFQGLWDGIVAGITWFINFAKMLFLNFTPLGLIINHWSTIVAFFQGIFGAIWDFIKPWVDGFLAFFRVAWDILRVLIEIPIKLAWVALIIIWDWIKGVFQSAVDWVTSVFSTIWGGIKALIEGPINSAWQRITVIWDFIMAVFRVAVDWVVNWVKARFDTFMANITFIFTSVRDFFTGIWNWIMNNIIRPVITWIVDFARERFETFKGNIDRIFNGVKDFFLFIWNWIRDNVIERIQSLVDKGKTAFEDFKTRVEDTFTKLRDGIGRIWDGIQEMVKKPIRFVVNTVLRDNLIAKVNEVLKKFGVPEIVFAGLPDSFATGGYTGAGPMMRPAGIVHADEFVVRKQARQRFEKSNPGALDYINRTGMLPGFFMGGTVPLPGATSIVRHSGYEWARWAGDLNKPNDRGAPIVAWMDGTVAINKASSSSYGNQLWINHGPSGQAIYAHMIRPSSLQPGTSVQAGQVIGHVGSTGRSFGDHLHFELRGGNAPIAAGSEGGGGGIFDWIGEIASKVTDPIKKLIDSVPGAGVVVDMVKGAGKMVLDKAVEWVKSKIPFSGSDGDNAGTPGVPGVPGSLGNIGVTANTRRKGEEILAAARRAGHNVGSVGGYRGDGEHVTRRALDFMVGNKAAGDFIANYVWANRSRLGLQHVIWWQKIISVARAAEGWRQMANRGSYTQNHMDHPHVLFSPADLPGFKLGGWTGPGGIVHANEFVIRQDSSRQLERSYPGALEYINRTGNFPDYTRYGSGEMPVGNQYIYSPILPPDTDPERQFEDYMFKMQSDYNSA